MNEIKNSKLWPNTAPQDLLVDPFDGHPLRFKAAPSGIVIYSLGENLSDDGGQIPSTSFKMRDVGFKLLQDKMVHDLNAKE